MDSLFFHPKVVHLPMALAVLMPAIAGVLALAWWRGWLPRKAWWLAVGLQAILAVSALMAMRSGEAEEDRVEKVVSGSLIHEHEEAAEGFVYAGAGVLVVMLVTGVLGARRFGLALAGVSTAGTLAVLALGVRAGEAGGKLVYQHGAANAYISAPAGGAGAPTPAPKDDHEHGEGGHRHD